MRVLVLLVLAVLFSGPVLAQESCYTDAQFEADRGLRLHTDVEVIMLTCRYSTKGENLQKIYGAFVKKNARQIRGWENVIAQTYGGSRNQAIDNFRTWLANQKGNESASMGPRNFCKQWADFVPYAASLTPAQVLYYVREPDNARPTKRPHC